jgi:hypothetical protein
MATADSRNLANVVRVGQSLSARNCDTFALRIAFRSSHGAAAQFARADGSVTWLVESLNYPLCAAVVAILRKPPAIG